VKRRSMAKAHDPVSPVTCDREYLRSPLRVGTWSEPARGRNLVSRVASVGLIVFVLMEGCSSPSARFETTAEGVDEVLVFASPMPINTDEDPGPDGFPIKVFLVRRDRPKSLAASAGRIEARLFEGFISKESAAHEPIETWNYDVEGLGRRMVGTPAGPAYDLFISWPKGRMPSSDVTIFVRYVGPSGLEISSRPVSLSVVSPTTKS
jgi:hypothetical protein